MWPLEIVSGSSLLPRIRPPGNSQWPLEIVSDLSFCDVSGFVADFLLQPFQEARCARAEVFKLSQEVGSGGGGPPDIGNEMAEMIGFRALRRIRRPGGARARPGMNGRAR